MAIKAQPRDLTKLLGKAKNRIRAVGIELEGGWKKLPDGLERLVHDGSVMFKQYPDWYRERVSEVEQFQIAAAKRGAGRYLDADLSEIHAMQQKLNKEYVAWQKENCPHHKGEIPSPPIKVDAIETWMRKHWPSHVNETCGMHVHLSFAKFLHYSWLMVPEYPVTVLHYMKLWSEKNLPADHHIWSRLVGKNKYCVDEFRADEQVQMRDKRNERRRTVINYCHALHETLECRLLPMMPDVDLGISAVKEFVKVTNAFLLADIKRERSVSSEIIVPSISVGVERDEWREAI